MSVATEIQRLNTAKAGIKSALEAKGVTVDSATTLDGYPQLVASIPAGGDEELVKGLIQGGLTALTVPSGVVKIKPSFALNEGSLLYVDLNNSVTGVGSSCFYNCSNLTAVTNASALTSVDSSGFRDCKKLTVISGMGCLTNIGQTAFENCNLLTNSMVISASTVGTGPYRNCWNIPSYTFLRPVTFDSFSDSESYAHFLNNTGCTYWDFSDTYVVSLFKNNKAFNGCTGEVRVCESMYDGWMSTVLPYNTSQTNKFYQSALSGNVVTVADKYPSTIAHYTNTGSQVSNPTEKSMDKYHEYGFGIVKNVYDATTGGTLVFYGPSALTPNMFFFSKDQSGLLTFEATGITSLGESSSTFYGCSNLTDVNLPNVTALTENCFYLDKSLTGLTLGNVSFIPKGAFNGCTSLTSFNFSTITDIGREAFMGSGLIAIDLSNVQNMIDTGANGNQFRNCSALTSAIVNCDVAGYCFAGCPNLTSVTFGTGVTEIMAYAFQNNTQNLLEMTFYGETPPTLSGGSNFYWASGLTPGVIYCPESAVDAYTSWKNNTNGISSWTVQAIS